MARLRSRTHSPRLPTPRQVVQQSDNRSEAAKEAGVEPGFARKDLPAQALNRGSKKKQAATTDERSSSLLTIIIKPIKLKI